MFLLAHFFVYSPVSWIRTHFFRIRIHKLFFSDSDPAKTFRLFRIRIRIHNTGLHYNENIPTPHRPHMPENAGNETFHQVYCTIDLIL
jgi:hypothetical protein